MDNELTVVLVGVAALLAAIIMIAIGMDHSACAQLAEVSGHKTQYYKLSGCYVRVNGRMIPKESWRGEKQK